MDYLQMKELYHHGIKGQKWGNRRYQYEDGSLTPAGKERYLKGVEKKKQREMYKDYKKIGKENDRKTMADRKIALGMIDKERKEGKISRFQAAIQKGQINAYVNRIGRELTKKQFIDKYGEENFKKMEERDVHNAEVGLAIVARTLASAALIGLTVKAVKKLRE